MAEFRDCRHLSRDGLSIYYRDYGDPLSEATPVLCLAGLTRNSKDFHATASRLAAGRRVICPDYRGRGRSDHDANPRNYRPATHIDDIRHLMVAAGLHRAIVIGTSFGGMLAMGMALAAPGSLRAVVLNDIGPDVAAGGLKRILAYIGTDRPQPDWDSAVAEMKRMFPTLSCSTGEEWLDAARATWRGGADGLLHYDWDVRLAGAISRTRAWRGVDPWALFRGLAGIPVLALRGELSDVLSRETFERMADEHGDLTAVTIPGCGHPPRLVEPAAMEALDDFLARF